MFRKFAIAAAIVSAPAVAQAAPIDLAAAGYELSGTEFSASMALATSFGGELFVSDGSSASADANDPMLAASYGFNIAGSADATAGDGVDISYMAGTVEVLLEGIEASGAYAAFDGGAALLTINSALFTDPFMSESADLGASFSVAFLNTLAPIPLPAGGLLLLTGAGALVLARRKSRA